jgi:hypothetical protein
MICVFFSLLFLKPRVKRVLVWSVQEIQVLFCFVFSLSLC